MLEEAAVTCPYCGETITVLVDCSAGPQRYVEDCFVCCQPIELIVDVDSEGGLAGIDARPEND
ncbi:CPXCG motif-containing cysteine-rich protein [Salinisphaera aquimarina]|uniref:CPXCG motif-containing cysteine-rich protein n=1 Tax=Salinisphaera aquimarina TaxID=2094031 RepID=A0ABV7EME8_9GAMM